MAISIRTGRVDDAVAVAELTGQLGYDVEPTHVAERLSRIVSQPGHVLLVAEADGRPVGWLHALVAEYIEAEAFVVIAGLVVDKGHRRHGIGRLLMERAEAWAREQGCSVVRLWSTAARAGAHRFYQGLGYAHIKTQYSFVKALDDEGRRRLTGFVPRIDPAETAEGSG